jgi:hypothetical protein
MAVVDVDSMLWACLVNHNGLIADLVLYDPLPVLLKMDPAAGHKKRNKKASEYKQSSDRMFFVS